MRMSRAHRVDPVPHLVTTDMKTRRQPPTVVQGSTLIEVVVASTASALLVVGLASSAYIAARALDLVTGPTATRSHVVEVLDQVVGDLHTALSFAERTATAVEFTVPDRDGDGQPETLRYAWGGSAGDPLTYSVSGSDAVVLLPEVRQLNLEYLVRQTPSPIPR